MTSADVRRRLPCEGALWAEGKAPETSTPYFGLVDKGPSHLEPVSEERTFIGGFAYAIEATENLSLVTMFFLQHAVNVSHVQELQLWLMRFKELDLRLMQ